MLAEFPAFQLEERGEMEIKGKGRQDKYGDDGSDGDGDGSDGDGVQEQSIPPNDRKLDNL